MGMYTTLRFKGVVKKEFREIFKEIALDGQWKNSSNEVFKTFGEVERSSHIPNGSPWLCPKEWQNEDDVNRRYDEDDVNRRYDEESGLWVFYCALKNYENTIEIFLDIVPYFIESIEYCEKHYEEYDNSTEYILVDGILKEK